MREFDYIIIGGGCAGLSLAYELEINEKLKEFRKKIKTKYEIVSVHSNKDLQKIKKLLIKYAN